MEPDLLAKSLSACPRCGAGVRADAPWCTQCFLNLRTPEPAPPAPAPAVPAPPVAVDPAPAPRHAAPGPPLLPEQSAYAPVDPLTAPLHAVLAPPVPQEPLARAAQAGRAWPCASCGADNAFELDACASCGQGFLSVLAGGTASLHVPGVGDLGTMSKGKRTGVALGAALALVLLVLVVGLLLG